MSSIFVGYRNDGGGSHRGGIGRGGRGERDFKTLGAVERVRVKGLRESDEERLEEVGV